MNHVKNVWYWHVWCYTYLTMLADVMWKVENLEIIRKLKAVQLKTCTKMLWWNQPLSVVQLMLHSSVIKVNSSLDWHQKIRNETICDLVTVNYSIRVVTLQVCPWAAQLGQFVIYGWTQSFRELVRSISESKCNIHSTGEHKHTLRITALIAQPGYWSCAF